MIKIVDLELTHEWLGDSPMADQASKKAATLERKQIRELRERHPIMIAVAFLLPWWAYPGEGESG